MSYTTKEMRMLQVQSALLASGGGESVREVAKRCKLAYSYVWRILDELVKGEQVDKVSVIRNEKHVCLYYTRWNEEMYADYVHELVGRMF